MMKPTISIDAPMPAGTTHFGRGLRKEAAPSLAAKALAANALAANALAGDEVAGDETVGEAGDELWGGGELVGAGAGDAPAASLAVEALGAALSVDTPGTLAAGPLSVDVACVGDSLACAGSEGCTELAASGALAFAAAALGIDGPSLSSSGSASIRSPSASRAGGKIPPGRLLADPAGEGRGGGMDGRTAAP
jgi:hypothetical protein